MHRQCPHHARTPVHEIRRTERLVGPPKRISTILGIILGLGVGGFVDGIALHQIAQWHNMGSAMLPPTTIAAMKQNMTWDGFFHLGTLVLTVLGVYLLLRDAHLGRGLPRAGAFTGQLLLGWGSFNLVEGVVDHHVLNLHHVRDIPLHVPLYDWLFLGFGGVGLMAMGWIALRRGGRQSSAGALTATVIATVGVASVLPQSLVAQGAAAPAETLYVYGPGGPLPAMRDAAVAFGRTHGVHVDVTGGPTPQWLRKARTDADVIFSGAEHMMTDFERVMDDSAGGATPSSRIDVATITPLYLRPSAILVRKGNPKRIRRFEDLLRPGVRLLVVQGAGQTGLWEDMAGRTGDIAVVRAFRANISAVAPTSGDARTLWVDDPGFDAWIIWNVWQVANPSLADLVPVAPRWRVYRDAGVALTVRGTARRHAREFVAFLRSPGGARIFARWGWITDGADGPAPRR